MMRRPALISLMKTQHQSSYTVSARASVQTDVDIEPRRRQKSTRRLGKCSYRTSSLGGSSYVYLLNLDLGPSLTLTLRMETCVLTSEFTTTWSEIQESFHLALLLAPTIATVKIAILHKITRLHNWSIPSWYSKAYCQWVETLRRQLRCPCSCGTRWLGRDEWFTTSVMGPLQSV